MNYLLCKHLHHRIGLLLVGLSIAEVALYLVGIFGASSGWNSSDVATCFILGFLIGNIENANKLREKLFILEQNRGLWFALDLQACNMWRRAIGGDAVANDEVLRAEERRDMIEVSQSLLAENVARSNRFQDLAEIQLGLRHPPGPQSNTGGPLAEHGPWSSAQPSPAFPCASSNGQPTCTRRRSPTTTTPSRDR